MIKRVRCNTPSSWGAVKRGVPQTFNTWTSFFFFGLLHINDLPEIKNNIFTGSKSKIVFFR
jgi:hypothetical protein